MSRWGLIVTLFFNIPPIILMIVIILNQKWKDETLEVLDGVRAESTEKEIND